MQNFVPSFHFVNPQEKLLASWCWDAVQWCWYQSNNRSLLWGKNVNEVNGYSSGDFSMEPFRRMYKSEQKKLDAQNENNQRYITAQSPINLLDISSSIGFVPLPLIPTKLNSAISVVHKIPVEVTATALDPLAAEKKKEDLLFLKNKPALEADLQELADQMQIGKVDLGNTKHSSVPFSNSPYGLDLAEPDELQVFVDLLYNLAVEAAFETVEQEFWDIKHGSQIKLLEIRDQLKFGVSCHRAFQSSMTELPDIEYEYPGTVDTPYSDLPDFSDNSHRFIHKRVTVMELFNYFSDEICNEETLYNIINGKEFGYCACNGGSNVIPEKDFSSFKINLVYCEIKSIDYVGVAPINKKSKFNYVVTEGEEAKKCTNKVWGQNTYGFWWLQNTRYFYGIHRLGFSHRTVGLESYQNFSTNIYKSQQKSAVELSIGENKKAQIADIKMQHAIIKSLPAGKYIDLKYLRNALSGLVKEENNQYTLQSLIELAFEQNIMVGDTEGFEGKNDGQLKPLQEIAGGVKSEVIGYMQIIADASQKISQFTGINDQLTGQSQNPEGLIGLEKLRINASINALNYVNEAIENQYQKLFTNWSSIIQAAVEKGGKAKEAIVNLIGAKKVSLIDALDELPLHTMGIKVTIRQREEERQEFREELNRLKINGVINTVDIYMLDAISNPKDKMALLAVKYKQWQKREAKKRAEDMANQQAMIKAQGENQVAATREKIGGEIQKIYAQGDTSSKILQLAAQLGFQDKQMDFLGKRALQQERGADQTNKAVQTLQTKAQLEAQKPLE